MREKTALRVLYLFSLLPSPLAAMVCYDILSPMHPEILTPVDCWSATPHSSLTKRGRNGIFARDPHAQAAVPQIHSLVNPRSVPVFGRASGSDASGQRGRNRKGPVSESDSDLSQSPKNKPSPANDNPPPKQAKVDTANPKVVAAVQVDAESVTPTDVSKPTRSPILSPPPPANALATTASAEHAPVLVPAPAPVPASASPSGLKVSPPSGSPNSESSGPSSDSTPIQPLLDHTQLSVTGGISRDADLHGHGDGGVRPGHDDNRDDDSDDDNDSDSDEDEDANLPYFDFAPDSPLNEILTAPALPAPTWSDDQQIFFNLVCNTGTFDACNLMSQTLDLAGWYVSQVTFHISMFLITGHSFQTITLGQCISYRLLRAIR